MKKKTAFNILVNIRISRAMKDELERLDSKRTCGISAICREAIALFLKSNLTKFHKKQDNGLMHEWEIKTLFSSTVVKKYLNVISYLSDYKYLKTKFKNSIGKKDIIKALRDIGINAGDCLFIHSSLSKFGHIDGNANTIIDAVIEVIGKNGTVLLPTFTNSFIYFDGSNIKGDFYRPYDATNPKHVWTGKVPQTFLERKGVQRSNHPTHSVAGIGPLAKECLSAHKESDPPTGENSPFSKLLKHGGKILYLGTGLAPTTFLHFLEDKLNLPYLKNAVCRIKDTNGNIRTVIIPKHLPGHRDFYTSHGESCKFFKKVISDGLKIKETSLGHGKIQLINAKDIYELGIKAIREDSNILLCDNPKCLFCNKCKGSVTTPLRK